MMIYRDNPSSGIKLFVDEAKRSPNDEERALLQQAATFGLRWCIGKNRAERESVLDK